MKDQMKFEILIAIKNYLRTKQLLHNNTNNNTTTTTTTTTNNNNNIHNTMDKLIGPKAFLTEL